ncbi:MAG: phage/plasmid primase, P4 family [Candidatus Sulfotelmatobacter sp.]
MASIRVRLTNPKVQQAFEEVPGSGQNSNLPYLMRALTDCGNAERLIDQHGECLRFCAAKRQWLFWNGVRWVAGRGSAVQLTKKMVRAMRHERSQLLSQSEDEHGDWEVARRQVDALTRWAHRSEGAAQISSALRMAESDPRVSVTLEELDRDPWVLNLPNGSMDLRSAIFREHRPEELITKVAGAEYKANARCPRWKKFLGEVFAPHLDIIPYLQRAVGYALTGQTREECIVVLVGSGRNGKSTLITLLHHLFGEYGGVAEMDTFLTSGANKLREDIADMRGRRFISAQEPFINSTFAEATIKWVSGGDKLRARRLYEHAQEFQPTHKLWLAMNRLPALRSNDHAAWSRLRIIPFDVSFTDTCNQELKHELRSELSGILGWALQGCTAWQRKGLGSAKSIEEAKQLWRRLGKKS